MDYAGAIEDSKKSLEIHKGFHDAYFPMGEAEYELQNYRKAIHDLTKTIKWDPKSAEAYYYEGLQKLD